MDNEIWSDAEDEWLSECGTRFANPESVDATLADLRARLEAGRVVVEALGDDDIPF